MTPDQARHRAEEAGEMSPSNERGSGRTTRQIKELPLGAVFVWCNSRLDYPRRLLRHLNRMDVVLVTPNWVADNRWRGQTFTGGAVDHAVAEFNMQVPAEFWDSWNILTTRIHK